MKSWNMLKFLGRYFDVGLACPVKYGDADVNAMLAEVDLLHFMHDRVEVSRSSANLLRSYALGVPLNVYRSRSTRLRKQIAAVAAQYDMILLDHYESAQYLPPDFHGRVVFHAHNATFLMWERYAKSGASVLHRMVAWAESLRVKACERRVCTRAELVFASPNDIDSFAQIGVDRGKCRVTYHLGDDSQLVLPALRYEDTGAVLLYVGTLSWEANVDGLLWFFDQVLPLVSKAHPEVEVRIVGGNPDARLLEKGRSLPNVVFTGFVDDLEPLLRQARLFLAPLRFGSGIKVKVLNAMCRGLPTITTRIGAEGIDAADGVHLSISDDAEEMARAIDHLMTDRQAWDLIAVESRNLVREKYTWEKVLGDMVKELGGGGGRD